MSRKRYRESWNSEVGPGPDRVFARKNITAPPAFEWMRAFPPAHWVSPAPAGPA